MWLCTLAAFAIEAPSLRCLSVDAAGQVTLSWVNPASTAGIQRYEIYFANDPGQSFTLVGQVNNVPSTSYTHTAADALNNARCYYYVNACSVGECVSSDTLCTIEFYLGNQGNGLAALNWLAPITPALPTHDVLYNVYREYPANTWTLVGTSANFLFRDTIDVCQAELGYRVELADQSGCHNVSRILRDQFSDTYAPDIPQLDSVSVDFQTSRITLGWEMSLAPDAFAYIIYHFENNMWIPIDTLTGIQNTHWVDTQHDATGSHQYRIATLDSCLNSSPMCDPQHNIHSAATFDLCRREAYLSWEPYEGMPLDVENYQIFYSVDGGDLVYAGEVAGDVHSFTLTGMLPQSHYDCFVRAVNYGGNVTASSLKCSFLFNASDNNDFAYIMHVSVVNNAYLEIKVNTGTTIAFNRVHLYRSVGDDQNFIHIAQIDNNGTDTYVFEDDGVRVDRNFYFYRASIENDCNVETYFSNISHNILLTGEKDNEFRQSFLDWNDYDGWDGGVDGYSVYRKTESEQEFSAVGNFLPSNTFSDDVSELRTEGEGFSYYVEASEAIDSYGFTEKSVSNTIILKQKPQTYIPNAFCPRVGGANSIFMPVNSYVTMENYNMYIYSREGVLLFHSTDPQKGWNGGYNGNLMPAGCYVYKITYTYGVDDEFEAVGTVTLVR